MLLTLCSIDKKFNLLQLEHNKTIKYLMDNYDTILIGNMSTKSIVEKKDTNDELKRELNTLKFYQLREKLKIKCIKRNKNYKLIDEYKTSMCCSNCGNEKNDLGTNKTNSTDILNYFQVDIFTFLFFLWYTFIKNKSMSDN